MVYKWLHNAHAFAYPTACVLCDAPGENDRDLCAACRQDLPRQQYACRLCALTLPGAAADCLCPGCRDKSPAFSASWALLRYEPPVDWLVTQLKFHARLSHARLFAQLMARQLRNQPEYAAPQALVPVPLHARRWRERGFNQATEIAQPLGRLLGLPALPHAAQRVLDTAHQADLPAKKRAANVRDAFTATPDPGLKHVAIVDDVVTTGATARALAGALKQAGIEKVQLWCAARA